MKSAAMAQFGEVGIGLEGLAAAVVGMEEGRRGNITEMLLSMCKVPPVL